jgi:MFS family permease
MRKRHYGWAILGLTFANLTVEGGAKSVVPVLFVALRDSFGRSATATAALFSAAGLVGALGAPLVGRLLDRMGPRYLFPLGGLLLLVGWLSSSFVTDPWQLFIFYSLIAAFGENIISSFTATATLAPWFPRTRGRVLGLADAGNPLGQGIFVPLAQVLIATLGWRPTFRIFAICFFLMVAPANFLFQRRPPAGPAAGTTTGEDTSAALAMTKLREGDRGAIRRRRTGYAAARPTRLTPLLRRPAVWFLVAARLTASTGHQLTSVHLVAFFIAAGYNPLVAASAIGGAGLFNILGRPISGALSDYLGREVVYTVGLGMQIAAILIVLILGNGHSLWPLILFVALSGLSDGIAGLVVGAKAADLFPPGTLGSVMGLVQMGRGVGIMVGPVIGGVLFDLHGDYLVAFSLAVGLVALAIGCMWMAKWTAWNPSRLTSSL